MCHYAQTMEQISEILLLKFVLNFLNCYCSYSFSPILRKCVKHSMCHYAQTMEQISEILLLKFVLNFLNFTFACSLCSSTSGAVLSQQASLVYQLE